VTNAPFTAHCHANYPLVQLSLFALKKGSKIDRMLEDYSSLGGNGCGDLLPFCSSK
jgi:hypothetical protein